jgi:DNA-binding GntR family transcriptional regulator
VNVPEGFTTAGFDLDRHPARYRYDVVAEHLGGLIESGQLPPNTRLPGEGDLARAYGVSLGTARHATRLLCLRGWVVTVRSKGTYVASER